MENWLSYVLDYRCQLGRHHRQVPPHHRQGQTGNAGVVLRRRRQEDRPDHLRDQRHRLLSRARHRRHAAQRRRTLNVRRRSSLRGPPLNERHNTRIVLAAFDRSAGRPLAISASSTNRSRTPGPGQVLLAIRYLSLDPYMRGRMSAASPMPRRWPSATSWKVARWPRWWKAAMPPTAPAIWCCRIRAGKRTPFRWP